MCANSKSENGTNILENYTILEILTHCKLVILSDDIKRVIKQCNTKFLLTVPEHLSKVEEGVRGTNVKVRN